MPSRVFRTHIEQLTEFYDDCAIFFMVADLIDDFAKFSNLFKNLSLCFLTAEICFGSGFRASVIRIIFVNDLKNEYPLQF